MTVQKHTLSLTTNGSGAASGVINFGFNNNYQRLVRIACDYSATADAGTDLTVTDGDNIAVFTAADVNTDFDKYVSDAVVSKTNGAVTNGQTAPLVRGPLTVAFAQGGATKTNVVSIWLERT